MELAPTTTSDVPTINTFHSLCDRHAHFLCFVPACACSLGWGKYAIVPEVVKFCLSSELFKEVEELIAKDADSMGSSSEEEFKLAYTEKHAAFVNSFEKRLEDFIISKKCTVEEFYDMCAKAQEHGDENIESFISILTQMLEFQTFVDLCRDKAKRQYVQQVSQHRLSGGLYTHHQSFALINWLIVWWKSFLFSLFGADFEALRSHLDGG